jgi:chromosome segregation ATPase
LVTVIEQGIQAAASNAEIQNEKTREKQVGDRVTALRAELDAFLKARGLSPENLSDVGKAAGRIAELEEEISSLRSSVDSLKTELEKYVSLREAAQQYTRAVEELLAPINLELKGQGGEVKPIELRYRFNMNAFRQAMIRYVTEELGEVQGRSAREDYVDSRVVEIDFAALGSKDDFLAKIPDDGSVSARALREYFGEAANYETLKLQAELFLLDVQRFGQIYVLYDDKPVENSSFGQRCTAVIVVLLLLGNMPIVIDEPEAHLDSALIAKYLVNLIKAQKLHRQIIFATHNANFVINGDADLIHCLSMEDSKVTSVVSTTIENLAHRERLLALEGGEKAFQQREKRYGID